MPALIDYKPNYPPPSSRSVRLADLKPVAQGKHFPAPIMPPPPPPPVFRPEPPRYLTVPEMLTPKEKIYLAVRLLAQGGTLPQSDRPIKIIRRIAEAVGQAHSVKDDVFGKVLSKQRNLDIQERKLVHAFALLLIRRPMSHICTFFKRDHAALFDSFSQVGVHVAEAILIHGDLGLRTRGKGISRWRTDTLNQRENKNKAMHDAMMLLDQWGK